MRRPLALFLASAALLGTGCVKPRPVVSSPVADQVAVASFRTDFDSGQVSPAPERLQDALAAQLTARNLEPALVDDDQLASLFSAGRNTRFRLARLAESAHGSPLVVLLEAESAFYAQVAGRYRWTVAVTLSLAPQDDLDAAVTRSFEVPVFMQFYHQQEGAALEEATPSIERQLGEVLDEFLTARQQG